MSDEIIEKFKQSDVTMVIETIGEDSYKESYTVVGNTAVTIKKIGGESEMIDWSGEKFTVRQLFVFIPVRHLFSVNLDCVMFYIS